jgi:hypothetical protein
MSHFCSHPMQKVSSSSAKRKESGVKQLKGQPAKRPLPRVTPPSPPAAAALRPGAVGPFASDEHPAGKPSPSLQIVVKNSC